MARPPRNNVDYFPFYCDEGNKMFYIEETYGNDGFATFIKLLRELAKTDYHYLDLSKPTTVMFLSAKCKVSKEKLLLIIDDLAELGKFNSVLWNENKVIWCESFIESIKDAYLKRNNELMTFDSLREHLLSLGVLKPSFEHLKGGSNPQSIVEYIKEKKSIEKETKVEGVKIKSLVVKNEIDFKSIIENFNSICLELPKVEKITKTRESVITARVKEYDLEQILTVFKLVSQSDYLSGKVNNWKASFDWIMNPTNFIKIIEGNYKNQKNGNQNSTTINSNGKKPYVFDVDRVLSTYPSDN